VATDLADGGCRRWLPRLRSLQLERAVRPVLVVVLDVLAQDAFELAAVEYQQPDQALARTVLTNCSAMAFACGARVGVLTIRMPPLPNTASKESLYLLSQSRISRGKPEGCHYSCRGLGGRVVRIGDRGVLVCLPRVRGAAGRARSASSRAGRQGRRAARRSSRARGPAPPGGVVAASCRGSCLAGGGGLPPATPLARRAPGHCADPLALASRAGAREVATAARSARAPTRPG
jgi:hypothetical protein